MSELRFHLVDVFADRPLAGNPVAVVPDADSLDTEVMQAVARELHQSETVFVLRATRPDADVRLRSFTGSGAEVAGAGHHTIGTWLWLELAGRLPRERRGFTTEVGDDLLAVEVDRGDPVRVTMRQSAPTFGPPVTDLVGVADALGLVVDDLDASAAPRLGSTGVGHLLVAARDRSAVDRTRPDTGRLLQVLAAADAEGCYVYSRDPLGDDAVAYARFFNPGMGIAEDVATGTAAGPLVARLVADGLVPAGRAVVVEQGHALHRPSRITVLATATSAQVTGHGVVAADGVLRVADPTG